MLRMCAPLFVLICACGGRSESPAGARSTRAQTAQRVAAVHPTRTSWDKSLSLSGALEAINSVQLGARVEGAITSVNVDLGDHVRAGAALAHIAPEDFRARIAQADADLAQARSDVARSEALAAHEFVAAQALEQARTRLATAQAARALAARQMRDTVVRAPFSGAIAARYIARGAYVKTGSPLFDVVEVDTLRLVLQVPERFAHEIGMGAVLSVRPEAAIEAAIEAPVNRVSPIINPVTRTYRVEARVEAAGTALRPGMFVTGIVHLGTTNTAVRIPRAAVYTVLGRDRVTRIVNGAAAPVDIEIIGEAGDDAIVEGLSPDDMIVTRGASSLAPGTPVQVEETTPNARGPG